MKLKRLIVHGFKSFKDRTTIHFDEAITGIVGPNGCGKSNIVDALFWIMGEQSAKHLRGNTMKDVIFSGSQKYASGAWAEVSLILDNDEGKAIHIGNKVSSPSEIQLTRKLYRNGDTEYRINSMPCRLRDIQEVFMDTGAGAKSYSIIAQGEISRLVQAKPEERRVMIEEVAGITKFKARKRESLKKIDQTTSNLARLSDLKQEIEKNLKLLEKQAEKAQKARSLKEKVERNELIVSSHKELDHLKALQELQQKSSRLLLDSETWNLEKDQLEISLEQERYEKDALTEQIEELQSDYNELSRELATSEEKVNSHNRTLEEKKKQIEVREGELIQIRQEKEQRGTRLSEIEHEKEQLVSFSEEDQDFSDLEERVELLKEQVEERQDNFKQLKIDIEQKSELLIHTEKKISLNSAKVDDFARNLEDITLEIESLEKDYSGVSTLMTGEREEVNSLEIKVREGEESLKVKKDQVVKLKESMQEIGKEHREKQSSLIKAESTLDSLKSIRSSNEGVSRGTALFTEENEATNWAVLSDLLSCEEQYQKPVQNLVRDITHYLVNLNGSGSGDIVNWIKQSGQKGCDFLQLSNSEESFIETLERLKLKGFEDVVELSSLFGSSEHEVLLKRLFNGYYISAELNIENVEELSSLSHFRGMASLDGSLLATKNGDVLEVSVLGDDEQGMGIVARNNKILELEQDVSGFKVAVSSLSEKQDAVESEFDCASAELESFKESLSADQMSFASKKAALESKLESFEVNSSRLTILQNRKQEISKTRLELLEEDEGLQLEKERLDEEFDSCKLERDDDQEQIELLQSQYDENKEELLEKQIASKSFEQQLLSCNKQMDDVQSQIDNLDQRIEHNLNLVTEYGQDIDQLEGEVTTLLADNLEAAELLQDREDVLSVHKDRLAEILVGMQEREQRAKELGSQINKSDKDSVEFEFKIRQHVESEALLGREIFETYSIDLRSALLEFMESSATEIGVLEDLAGMFVEEIDGEFKALEVEDYSFIRRYGKDLEEAKTKLKYAKLEYNKLGEINWQAIHEFERQQHRFHFLHAQEQELKTSLDDLQLAIDHIDQKSRERFQVAFTEVSARFEKVFPIIFGGGSAKLEVVGNVEDPECGVDIIAQPPGKKMQNINAMSGGEKAMTAVSLIFSIFLVKPSPFCLLDEVDAPLDDANVDRFNELLREMSSDSQFILITHNKKTMELNDTLYGITMQEPGVSKAVSVQLH